MLKPIPTTEVPTLEQAVDKVEELIQEHLKTYQDFYGGNSEAEKLKAFRPVLDNLMHEVMVLRYATLNHQALIAQLVQIQAALLKDLKGDPGNGPMQ